MLPPLSIIWASSEAAELQVCVDHLRLVQKNPADDVLELAVTGEVDLATVGPLREAAERATGSGAYRVILFDLTGVSFMDSTGLHVVANTNRQMRAAGRAVEVRCSAALARLFTLMGLDRVIEITTLPDSGDLVAA